MGYSSDLGSYKLFENGNKTAICPVIHPNKTSLHLPIGWGSDWVLFCLMGDVTEGCAHYMEA